MDSGHSLSKNNSNASGCVGTPLYFSPEQSMQYYGGKNKTHHELDEKVDIYALGLILLELSTQSTATSHEKMSTFNFVKEKRRLPPHSKHLAGTVEGELILLLTEERAESRPSAETIKREWLPKWNLQLA